MKNCKGFGLMKSAKARDSWSSWGMKGAIVFHLLCFLFLWCFVACMWWGLFFFLHGCDNVQHGLDKNLAIFGVCDGRNATIAVYEQVFN